MRVGESLTYPGGRALLGQSRTQTRESDLKSGETDREDKGERRTLRYSSFLKGRRVGADIDCSASCVNHDNPIVALGISAAELGCT